MELTEAARRVLGQHWRLIVLVVVAGIGLAVLIQGGNSDYTASTRLVLDTADPKARTESQSIADTAKALATSPSLVQNALKNAHVEDRDAVDVAKNHVSVSALGTSGVLELKVSDRNRHVAAAVANGLAQQVIRTRLSISNGEVDQVVGELDRRIDESNRKISTLDATVDSLNVQAATAATADEANALRARRDDASRSRDFLVQQRGILESERVTVISGAALRPKPSIVSEATLPVHAGSSGWLQSSVLGAILGLILGVGIAGLIETFRPTLVGGESLARELGVPFLGTLSSEPGQETISTEALTVANRLRLAARSVQSVGLVPARPDVKVQALAQWLDREPRLTGGNSGEERTALRVRAFDVATASPNGAEPASLVVVSPPALMKTELMALNELLGLVSLPVLGLIVYSPRHPQPLLQPITRRLDGAEVRSRARDSVARARSVVGLKPTSDSEKAPARPKSRDSQSV